MNLKEPKLDTSDYVNLKLLCEEPIIYTYWHRDDTDESIQQAKQRNAFFKQLCNE